MKNNIESQKVEHRIKRLYKQKPLHVFKAIATEYKNYRYTAKDGDGNRCRVNSDDRLGTVENHKRAAFMLVKKMEWTDCPLIGGWFKRGVYVWCIKSEGNQ